MNNHVHEYSVPEVKLVQSEEYPSYPNRSYSGGYKGLVIKKCKCGHETAIDYGELKTMKDKWIKDSK